MTSVARPLSTQRRPSPARTPAGATAASVATAAAATKPATAASDSNKEAQDDQLIAEVQRRTAEDNKKAEDTKKGVLKKSAASAEEEVSELAKKHQLTKCASRPRRAALHLRRPHLQRRLLRVLLLRSRWPGRAGRCRLARAAARRADWRPVCPRRELAAKVAHNGRTIMVTWANYHYRDFVENWVAHLKEAGCKFFIVGEINHRHSYAYFGVSACFSCARMRPESHRAVRGWCRHSGAPGWMDGSGRWRGAACFAGQSRRACHPAAGQLGLATAGSAGATASPAPPALSPAGAMDDKLLQYLLDQNIPTFSMSSGLTTAVRHRLPRTHPAGRQRSLPPAAAAAA